MKKFFLTVILILTMLTATAFAAENETAQDTNATENVENAGSAKAEAIKNFEPYEYVSETYGFKIICPTKPIVVVKPFEDPKKDGELLVFVNEGIRVLYGYIVELDAFDNLQVPDFNSKKKDFVDGYVERKRGENLYSSVELLNITQENKGIVMVTAKELEITDDKGNVQGTATADEQMVVANFRTKFGRCISVKMIDVDLDDSDYKDFLKSLSTFRDAGEVLPDDSKDKKTKDKKTKKDKKDKKDKKKDKKQDK